MNIALIGYGKMGKAIEQEALARNHQIVARIDKDNLDEIKTLPAANAEVVIEFTHPDSFFDNLDKVLPLQIPVVTGTTGWHDEIGKVEGLVKKHDTSLLYSSNFSIGVNLLFKLNQRLAELMNAHAQYDCYIEEQHHRHKADAPSGTAHSLANQIIGGLDRKSEIATDSLLNRKPKPDELSIGYIRSGEIIGKHKVSYTSEIDSISITHEAYNRRGFALGAVIAAEWLYGKKGLHNFADIF